MITGPEACRRYGLRIPQTKQIHVLVPKKRRGANYVVILHTTHIPAPVLVDGFPLAPPARAIYDACRTTTNPDTITTLVANAAQQGLCDPQHLERELKQGNTHGTSHLRQLLADLHEVRSVAEQDALNLSRSIGLTTKYWNATIEGPDGTVLGRPDAWFDDVALAWEIDSRQFHLDPKSYARTLERNTRYATAGIVLVQTLPARLRTDPQRVANELLKAHQAAEARPRPPVRVTSRRPPGPR